MPQQASAKSSIECPDQRASRQQSVWFPVITAHRLASIRLFCFPYAGGSASIFGKWAEYFPPEIEVRAVQLPGRWNRLNEQALARFDDLVSTLGNVFIPYLDRPFAFFGHSMGALVAFEMCRFLRRHQLPQPVHLFVSGRRAPQIPDQDPMSPDLPEAEFVARLQRLQGTPEEVFENTELMELLLPTLRADFSLVHSYTYVPDSPLTVPITIFAGVEDEEAAEGRLEAWEIQTCGGCCIKTFPGNHFYLHSARSILVQLMAATLTGKRKESEAWCRGR